MFIVICYDVETTNAQGRRRLRKIAKICESHGQRAQKSVFECKMDESLYIKFEHKLLSVMDKNSDSLRIYILDEFSVKKIKNFGKAKLIDYEEPQII